METNLDGLFLMSQAAREAFDRVQRRNREYRLHLRPQGEHAAHRLWHQQGGGDSARSCASGRRCARTSRSAS